MDGKTNFIRMYFFAAVKGTLGKSTYIDSVSTQVNKNFHTLSNPLFQTYIPILMTTFSTLT